MSHTCDYPNCRKPGHHYWEVHKEGKEGFWARGYYCPDHFLAVVKDHLHWRDMETRCSMYVTK